MLRKQAQNHISDDEVPKCLSEERRIRYNATRLAFRKARIDKGLCRDCGKVPFEKGKVVCHKCFLKRCKRFKNRRKRLIKNKNCLQCNKPHTTGKTICQTCMNKQVQSYRNKRKKNKEFIVNYFGGKCNVCGENDIRCLGLDHVNGDGYIDKKSDTGKKQLTPQWYAKLIKLIKTGQELPRQLQLLCHNCHAKKDLIPWWHNEENRC